MLKWKRTDRGYASDCGRFRVERCLSRRHTADGFRWVAWDDGTKDSVIFRTAARAKEQARVWSMKQVIARA